MIKWPLQRAGSAIVVEKSALRPNGVRCNAHPQYSKSDRNPVLRNTLLLVICDDSGSGAPFAQKARATSLSSGISGPAPQSSAALGAPKQSDNPRTQMPLASGPPEISCRTKKKVRRGSQITKTSAAPASLAWHKKISADAPLNSRAAAAPPRPVSSDSKSPSEFSAAIAPPRTAPLPTNDPDESQTSPT